MISFIIIGRNEGFKLEKCLKSVHRFASNNNLADYETIYVDSDSQDDSIHRVIKGEFADRVIRLSGKPNAAAARNAGARLSYGEILFFIDGDMELNEQFNFQKILSKNYILGSGQIENIFYNNKFEKVLYKAQYYKPFKNEKTERYFGGLFVIDRALWLIIGGMREEFKYGEDLDLSMRLARAGYRLTRYEETLAYHHTIIKSISMKNVVANAFYSRALLYRRHIFSSLVIHRIIRSDSTVIVLVSTCLLCLLFSDIRPLFIYPMIVCLAILYKNGLKKNFLYKVAVQTVRDAFVILTFLFFWPTPQNTTYKTVYEKS